MVKCNDEKTLSADIKISVLDDFLSQTRSRGFTKKRCVEAAIRLWTDLPVEVQAKILDGSMDTPALFELVQKVVDERIEAGRQAAERLAKRHRRRPP